MEEFICRPHGSKRDNPPTKHSKAALGVCDGRWPHPRAPRGQDSSGAPKCNIPKVRCHSTPTFVKSSGPANVPVPSKEAMLTGRTQGSCEGGGPGQFYVLRAKSMEAPPKSGPFYDIESFGGKKRGIKFEIEHLPQRFSLMREGSEKRFRGKGGEKLGLYIGTPPNLGPGQYLQHGEWLPAEIGGAKLPNSPTASADHFMAGGTGFSLNRSTSVPHSTLGRVQPPRGVDGEEYNHGHIEEYVFKSARCRIPAEGGDCWMPLRHRSAEVNGDTLKNDERHRSKKFNGAQKGALIPKTARNTVVVPIVENSRLVLRDTAW